MMMMDDTHAKAGTNGAEMRRPELTPLSQPGGVTAMDLFIFESWGSLIVPDVLGETECDEALEACKRIHGSRPAETFRQVGRGYETEAALERLMDHPPVLPKLRALLGDRFVMNAAWATVVPAGTSHL